MREETEVELCQVEGCEEAPSEIIDLNQLPGRSRVGVPRMDWGVCDFHAQALNEGQWFTLEDDDDTIVMNGAPLSLLNIRTREGLDEPTVVLVLGRDGVTMDEVTIQVGRDLHKKLVGELFDDESTLSREIRRNQPSL